MPNTSNKLIVITGATDGIGLLSAEKFVNLGHKVVIHGRNAEKLLAAKNKLDALNKQPVISIKADLAKLSQVESLAYEISALVKIKNTNLDLLINNAGVFKLSRALLADGQDQRFVVNCIAPYLLTRRLTRHMQKSSRIINLSSAAQASVELAALTGEKKLTNDFDAYAQSKLALTQWSSHFAANSTATSPLIIALNPGSMLASKMVKEGFGVAGKDLNIGADVLVRAGLSDEFGVSSGLYFDNDIGRFAAPHKDALETEKNANIVHAIESKLMQLGHKLNNFSPAL